MDTPGPQEVKTAAFLLLFSLVWGGGALALGASYIEAVLTVLVALLASGYYQLSTKVDALEKRVPPPPNF